MNENLTFFPFCKKREIKSVLKVVWMAFFLMAPLFYVQANSDGSEGSKMMNKNDHLNRDAMQSGKTVTGTVTDNDGNALPGVTVFVKGTTIGTVTDIDGNYSVEVENEDNILVFSFIGMAAQEIPVAGKNEISVTLSSSNEVLEDVVVVGYGVQKKESVVGAITRAKGEELLQAGGVTNVGEALQGRLPGVTTIFSSGLPGENDPKIFIRGQSSWNGSGQPLILVDGIERGMSDIDLNEIDQISVLKDASATAVFGVKGANGVILITTKRGQSGKAQLTLSANSTVKMYSKIPDKLESYDAIMVANESIMRELSNSPTSWGSYVPLEIADKFRNPASVEESYIYPNVDWTDVILKDYAMDHRVNLSVQGGSDFAKYFGSLSFQSVSDLFNGQAYDNGKGYASEYSYDRFNYRSNLDFDITKTTKFSVNLSGFLGIQEKPNEDLRQALSSIYELSPAIYTPIFPDGYYGRHLSGDWGFENPIVNITNRGYNTYYKFQINSDFMLEQDLEFITKGLKFKGKLSYDNNMTSTRTLNDPEIESIQNVVFRMYDIDGNEFLYSPEGLNDFDFVVQPWNINPTSVNNGSRMRRLNYELSLNYRRIFGEKHTVSALALMKREEYAIGNMFPRYREDWVARVTYDYDSRYFLDINGAYNGSEKFSSEYRFDLFPSAALGWMISNESFMEDADWLDKLKVRGSYGLVGDDNFSGRWKYMSQWSSGGYAYLVPSNYQGKSPYLWYKESVVGNPDLHWETAIKSNIGFEAAVLQNKFTVDFDYFMEDRFDILITGNNRSVPDFYGTNPADVNSGKVKVRGYELVLGANHQFNRDFKVWGNFSLTDARDEILYKEDPELMPFYRKAEGYPIGQTRSAIAGDILTNWDDIYMSTPLISDQGYRRPGYYDLVDFNIDGNYNGTYDNAPYGYSDRPQKTWTVTAGAGYKGFNLMVQLYGTQNATRNYDTRLFIKETYLFYSHMLDYWSVDNPDGVYGLPRWTVGQAATDPYADLYDASLIRLKTVELSYDIPKKVCNSIGIKGLRIFANGNNLYLWTDLPDDREFNGSNTQESQYRGDYPTMKRFNFGLNLKF